MKKKISLSLFAVLFVAIAIMGTVAYFSKSFTSTNNTATAAKFEVDAVNKDGSTIGSAEFNLDGKLYPGMKTIEAYSFQIHKNKTEVPVEYKVNLTPDGELFPEGGGSPIAMTLQREIENEWVNIDYSTAFRPNNDIESFKILIDWPHGDNDIDFQGKTGNIKLEVVATQVDGDETGGPTDPENPNDITANLANTVEGKAASEGQSAIYSYKFEEGYAPKMSNFKFNIYDGDGYVNEWYMGGTQKVVNGVVYPRTGAEVAEAIVQDFYVTLKGSFTSLTNKWDVTNVGSEVVFTSKAKKAYDGFKIVVPEKDNRSEIKGEFFAKQEGSAGHSGIQQVSTLTIQGTAQKAGALDVSFFDGVTNVTKTINLNAGDTPEAIAAKIASEFGSLADWHTAHAEGSANVVFTAKAAGENKELTITLTNR
ncbi:hypothetical protein [Bacillus sp. S/N-304-OC-R1]|uniref:hypothetical protein n=1 Tax=Bacillus sp. S/N-304-OC-R1 TaxID=2758034 RepID=UPI001C8D63C3|nr:hypothetical protein [Bacillus sp. S/N-304-OC-R1]MBY0121127.1 hypothetical protein [Bacillus sp. S/N-304-OC-R1]